MRNGQQRVPGGLRPAHLPAEAGRGDREALLRGGHVRAGGLQVQQARDGPDVRRALDLPGGEGLLLAADSAGAEVRPLQDPALRRPPLPAAQHDGDGGRGAEGAALRLRPGQEQDLGIPQEGRGHRLAARRTTRQGEKSVHVRVNIYCIKQQQQQQQEQQ